MDVELLTVSGCPNVEETERHLRHALVVIGRADGTIRHTVVESVEEAERRNFAGSPTVVVDGCDLLPAAGPAGLTCRIYDTEGTRRGGPSVAELVDALRRCTASSVTQ